MNYFKISLHKQLEYLKSEKEIDTQTLMRSNKINYLNVDECLFIYNSTDVLIRSN